MSDEAIEKLFDEVLGEIAAEHMQKKRASELSEPTGDFTGLLYGGNALVPLDIAKCPECGAQLHAESTVWGAEKGEPTTGSLLVDCTADLECTHRHWQCDWQPVIDAIEKWCGATDV